MVGDELISLSGQPLKIIKIINEKFSGKVYNLKLKYGDKYSVTILDFIVYDD
jgi:hypothetical protein